MRVILKKIVFPNQISQHLHNVARTIILKYWISNPAVQSQIVQLWNTKYALNMCISLISTFSVIMEVLYLYDVDIPFRWLERAHCKTQNP